QKGLPSTPTQPRFSHGRLLQQNRHKADIPPLSACLSAFGGHSGQPDCFRGSLPPPALGECGHRILARRAIAVRRCPIFVTPEGDFGQNKTPPRVCRNNRGGALMLRRSSERLHFRTLPARCRACAGRLFVAPEKKIKPR